MKLRFTFLMVFCLSLFSASAQVVDVVTGLSFPFGLALNGNELYISELGGNKISKIDISQPNPTVSNVVSGVSLPGGMLLIGNELYFTELTAGRVKKIDITQPNPVPETVVELTGISANEKAGGLALYNGELYISTVQDNRIVKIDLNEANPPVEEVVTGLSLPFGLEVKGSILYISEFDGNKISKIDLSLPNPVAETVVTGVSNPGGINFNGNFLYIASGGSSSIGKISRIDILQSNPILEEIITDLNNPRLSVFNGLDIFVAEAGAGKIISLEIGAPVFSTLPSVCLNSTPSTLGGASPTGGVYSGPGVTDNGDGDTFTFDPVAAGGPGTYTVTYTAINGQTATSSVTVVASPSLTSSSTPNTGANDGTATVNASGGTSPYTYAWSNGATTPTITGLANGTYDATVTDANGCEAMASVVVALAVAGDDCTSAQDINALFGQPQNEPQTSGLWNNIGATATGDPAEGFECFFNSDGLQHTIWFTFTGDGNTYRIRSVECDATDYINDGDTQAAIYTGGCSSLSPAACNDDEDAGNNILNISLDLATVEGTTYRMLIDGYGGADGEFCLEVTNLTPSAVVEISGTGIEVFPNPTRGEILLTNVQADEVRVYDNMGRLVLQVQKPGASIDISSAPAGLYFLKITEGEQVYSARIVKE